MLKLNNMKFEEHLLPIVLFLILAGGVGTINYAILCRRDNASTGVYHVTIDDTSYVSDICPYVNTESKYVRMSLHGNTVKFPFNNTITIKLENK